MPRGKLRSRSPPRAGLHEQNSGTGHGSAKRGEAGRENGATTGIRLRSRPRSAASKHLVRFWPLQVWLKFQKSPRFSQKLQASELNSLIRSKTLIISKTINCV